MIKITYFVHGTSTHNEKQIAAGWFDCKLSRLGKKQAKELGNLVTDKQFDVVFCSDLKRAADTAELAFSNKCEIFQDKRLREINLGIFTNSNISELRPKLPDYIDKPFPSGESYKDVEKRIADFIDFLRSKYSNKHVAIVAHNAPQLALEVILNKKTWSQAFKDDWRIRGGWQPGWDYLIEE